MSLVKRISYLFFNLVFPLKVFGKENMIDGAGVVLYNHFHFADSGLIVRTTPKDTAILAKKELFEKKILAWYFRKFNAIPVDRDNPSISTIFAATKVLRENRKLALFPEGTRNRTGSNKLLPLKSGCAIFAIKAKCPIIPVMQLKKSRAFRKTFVSIGKAFELSQFYDQKITEEVLEECNKIIRSKMEKQYDILLKQIKQFKSKKKKKKVNKLKKVKKVN